MIKIEDFKNAPVGATATHPEGARAMKIDDGEQSWITQTGLHVSNEHVWGLAYTLDPSAATAAREALDLAWVLAHPVKPGQVIPKGTRYLEVHNSGLKEYTAPIDLKIIPGLASARTVEPLPEPGTVPYWIDAPAVLAHTDNDHDRGVWTALFSDQWVSTDPPYTSHWRDLRNVIPLYPKEGQNA